MEQQGYAAREYFASASEHELDDITNAKRGYQKD
jgi:hypothetical protein